MRRLTHQIPLSIIAFFISFTVLGAFVPAATAHAAPESTVVEAEILEVSQYPDAQKLDYPNCLVAAKIRVHQILSGAPMPEFCEALFMLYENKKADQKIAAVLKPSRKVRLKLIDFDLAPENIRETQQANDFLDVNGAQCYVTEVHALRDFSPILFPQTFKGQREYKSVWEHPVNPPRPAEDWSRRQARMEKKRAEVAAQLRLAQQATTPDITVGEALNRGNVPYRTIRLFSQDIAFFLYGKNLFSIPIKHRLREKTIIGDDDCARLKKLNEFFLRHQIELMVVLIPDAYNFAKRIVFHSMRDIPDLSYYHTAKLLLDNGIEPVIIYPQLLAHWQDFDLLFGYHNYDYHPNFGAAEIGGRVLADILHEHGLDDPDAKKHLSEKRMIIGYPEHIKKEFDIKDFAISPVMYRHKQIPADVPESPILVLGNSFARSPRYDASIASRMAFHSGVLPDLLKSEGHGVATIIPKRLLLNSDRYLRGKKICFLILHPVFIKNYPWADIQALDKIYSAIGGQNKFIEIPPESVKITGASEHAPDDKSSSKDMKYHKRVLPQGWRFLHSPNRGKQYNRVICELPADAVSDKPRLLCINAFASQIMRVTVADKTESLYANRDCLIFDLPAGTKIFTLEVQPNQIYALGPIRIIDNQTKE